MSEYRKRKRLIEELARCYESPKPQGKRKFFRALPPQKSSVGRMLLVQLGYLSGWVWPVSALLFFVMLGASLLHVEKLAGLVFGVTPFLVLLSVTELSRSHVCRMEELEAATVCSLPGILLSRMLILGAVNLLSLCVTAAVLAGDTASNLIYLLTPYFLTAALSLGCVRRLRGREAVTVCGVVAAFVCFLQIAVRESGGWIYETRYLSAWVAVLAVGAFLTGREAVRTLRQAGILHYGGAQ